MDNTDQTNAEIAAKIDAADAAARAWQTAATAWAAAPTDANGRAQDAAVQAYYEACADLHLTIGAAWRQGLRLQQVDQEGGA